MPAPAWWDLHGELISTLNAGAIVRAGQSTPRLGLVWAWPGCQWKPLQNAGNHSGNHRLETAYIGNFPW